MMQLSVSTIASSKTGLDGIIARILADNAMALATKNKLTAEAFDKILRSSLKRTGYNIMQPLKEALGEGSSVLGAIAPKRVFSKTGVIMDDIIDAVKPAKKPKSKRVKRGAAALLKFYATPNMKRPPGWRFGSMMEYAVLENTDSGEAVEIGMLEGGRASQKWKRIFADWQEKGDVDLDGANIRGVNRGYVSMQKYFAAIGIPTSQWTEPERPARPIMKMAEDKLRPAAMFEKYFVERLLR